MDPGADSKRTFHPPSLSLIVYMCDCVCNCIYVYMCVYMCPCVYLCVCMYMCVQLCLCVYVCVCVWLCICVCICVYVGVAFLLLLSSQISWKSKTTMLPPCHQPGRIQTDIRGSYLANPTLPSILCHPDFTL